MCASSIWVRLRCEAKPTGQTSSCCDAFTVVLSVVTCIVACISKYYTLKLCHATDIHGAAIIAGSSSRGKRRCGVVRFTVPPASNHNTMQMRHRPTGMAQFFFHIIS